MKDDLYQPLLEGEDPLMLIAKELRGLRQDFKELTTAIETLNTIEIELPYKEADE